MDSRVIHYGEDLYYRLQALRNAGYTVDNCSSLSEFRWTLHSGARADAVVFSERYGKAPHTAISLARARSSPLVLFQGWDPHYDESEFNLVIPMLTSTQHWLSDVALLIENTRANIQASSELRAQSRELRGESMGARERTVLEFRRSAREIERNRGFEIDFLRTDPGQPEHNILPGQSRFLRSLSDEEWTDFKSLMRINSCPAGTRLFVEDELPHHIHIVLCGQVKLSVNSSDGRRFIVDIAHPGEILGLAAAFSSSVHQLTAESCYFCELGSIGCSDFIGFLERHPRAFRAAAEELGRAHNQACVRLRTMGVSITVMERLSGLLLEWSANGVETERGTQIRLALTHAEIGQCIGTSRESVTRTLHEFQERQIIDQNGSMLTILDRAALESRSGVR